MSQEDPLTAVFAQFQEAHLTEANAIQWYHKQMLAMRRALAKQGQELAVEKKKNEEIQPNLKKK